MRSDREAARHGFRGGRTSEAARPLSRCALYGSHPDFDISFALIFAWLEPETGHEAEQILNRYWLRACEALSYGPMWAKTEMIATALLANRHLSREEITKIYGETVA